MQRSVMNRLVAEIDQYLETGTTAMAAEEMTVPVANYADPAVAAAELALLRRVPVIVGQSSQLGAPGEFLSDELAGVPLLVARQRDGSLRAFANTCRHRGALLTEERTGTARTFTCPYHAWTFALDGRLTGMPHAEGFCGLDRSSYGLLQLPVAERHGLIWAVLTPSEEPLDVRSWLGEALDDELASYGSSGWVVERSAEIVDDLNWKLVMDGFLESYHLRFLHATTVGPWIRTNLAPTEALGPHSRVAMVRTSYETARAAAPSLADFDLLPHTATVYPLFPNGVLVWQADHFEVWTTWPVDAANPGRSRSRVSLLAPEPPSDERAIAHWERNWKILMDTVRDEDFAVSRGMQRAFASGVQREVTFGRNEPALQHFHRELAARLATGGGNRP